MKQRARLLGPALWMAMMLAGPMARAGDARLVEVPYDPHAVVRIEGKPRVQVTIRFGEDEKIENVAIGDSQAWQVTPNKRADLLFVKPLSPNAATNMTVVTSKRTYLFDLISSPRARPVYLVGFSYPEQATQPAEPGENAASQAHAAPILRASEAELAAARDPYAVLDPEALNFAWQASGSAQLLPESVFDDGRAVFLKWSAGRPVPAILILDQEGTEGPVNYTIRGDMVVIDGVPERILLRSGEEEAMLIAGSDAGGDKRAARRHDQGQSSAERRPVHGRADRTRHEGAALAAHEGD